jgi:glutathione peroxidase-family protein
VRPRHGDAVRFVHVEIFKDPRNQILADAVTEWHLPSEPWIFFIDRTGTIVERFDGIATAEEIDEGIARIV